MLGISYGQENGTMFKSNVGLCFADPQSGESRPCGNTVDRVWAGWKIPTTVDRLAGAEQE